MRVQTTDPTSLKDVADTKRAPFVIEGIGEDAMRIFFVSDENRQADLNVEYMELGGHNVAMYNETTGESREM